MSDYSKSRCSRRLWVPTFTIAVLLVAMLLVAALNEPTNADVFYRAAGTPPIVGTVIERNEETLTIRLAPSTDGPRQIELRTEEIEFHAVTVSPQRLEQLQPGQWNDYRDYAEELSAQTIDPTAHELAVRLFLIVAYHSQNDQRQAAFQHLFRLARTPNEEKRLRALAFAQVQPQDPRLLRDPERTQSRQLTDEDRKQLIEMIRRARRGEAQRALELADQSRVQEAYASVAHIMGMREFRKSVYELEFNPQTLRKLATLELALTPVNSNTNTETTGSRSGNWSQLINQSSSEPFLTVDWFNVTEFDPRQSVYADGAWQEAE